MSAADGTMVDAEGMCAIVTCACKSAEGMCELVNMLGNIHGQRLVSYKHVSYTDECKISHFNTSEISNDADVR